MMEPDELRKALDALGLDREEVARRLGVSPATVRHWLSGRHAIPGPAARLIRLWTERPELRPKEVSRR